jgi:hypothetical protein
MKVLSLLRIVAPALAGAAAGLTVVAFSRAPSPHAVSAPPPEASVAAPAIEYSTSSGVGADGARIAALEKKLADLSATHAPANASASSPPSSPPDWRREREADVQRVLDAHNALLDRHDVEPRDGAWASKEEKEVGAKLEVLSEAMNHAFVFRSVECRTSSCVAQLEWPTQNAAKGSLTSLLSQSGDTRCAREIAFPPADGAGPYPASFYLDCAEDRWPTAEARQ